MRIIGAIGANGSGKDEVLRYLNARYGVPFLSTGEMVREIAARDGVEPTREQLGAISRRAFAEEGAGCFVRRAAERIAKLGWPVAGISGIRSADDVRVLKGLQGADTVLIHVAVTHPRVRFERMTRRGEARDPLDYGHFLRLDVQEEEQFRVSEAATFADHTLVNDGPIEALHRSIDRCVDGGLLHGRRVDRLPRYDANGRSIDGLGSVK